MFDHHFVAMTETISLAGDGFVVVGMIWKVAELASGDQFRALTQAPGESSAGRQKWGIFFLGYLHFF